MPDRHVLSNYTPAQSPLRIPGGLNFDAKLRRESTDLKDLFYAHIRCSTQCGNTFIIH